MSRVPASTSWTGDHSDFINHLNNSRRGLQKKIQLISVIPHQPPESYYGDLNVNVPTKHIYVNTWSSTGGTV